MLYKYNDGSLEMLESHDIKVIDGKEKDLENLLAQNLSDLYVENGQLMPIFQERAMQEEPDLCALDKNGNLVIFELKRSTVTEDVTLQVMRYCQNYGHKNYSALCDMYNTFLKDEKGEKEGKVDLQEAHKYAFGLDQPLSKEEFNRQQRLILVGSSADYALMENVSYWKKQGIDIDYIPYRFYKINGDIFFEFFAKPYDYHINPKEMKGIIFDTNRSYDEKAIWDMMSEHKVSAYGDIKYCVKAFNKGDYVLYYHKGYGVVGGGRIKSSKSKEIPENYEMYMDVELLTPELNENDGIKHSISASELKQLLNKGFYFAKTTKVPYLSVEESQKVVDALLEKFK